jgi:transglutaminase-like putative cysteine protease
MSFTRRSLLAAACGSLPLLSGHARAADIAGRMLDGTPWRTFELLTTVETDVTDSQTQVWVPLPSVADKSWITPWSTTFTVGGGVGAVKTVGPYDTRVFHAVAKPDAATLKILVRTSVVTRDRRGVLDRPAAPASLSAAERDLFTKPTSFIPTDGIVAETAQRVTAGAQGDTAKARAIYEWIVANCFRDPKIPGCGLGNIKVMLDSGYLGGKCADLNALFVGLARAAGLPARDLYGIRVAPSRMGFTSLGAKTETITKAQHCRAEVYLDKFGWVPVDPADVRKVALEEPPGNLPLDDVKVVKARELLFGGWEGNWIAYNAAHDVELPGSRREALPFLMYPQGETKAGRLNPLDPGAFKYAISVRELDT